MAVNVLNLSEQIRGAVLLLAEKWTPKELCMDMQFGEHLIYANEELLKQVWINLLDNAIKFSEPNGTVSVAITESGDRLSVLCLKPRQGHSDGLHRAYLQ